MSEATIFAAAVDKPAGAERDAYLAQACAGDEKLRRRIEALLRAHSEPDDILDPPQRSGAVDHPPIPEKPGSRIGPYRLMEQIGEGGFGLVFVAEQQEPVRRKVALKVIKPGMDSRQVIARFEAERQALALMDHPNIARVLDAGATDSGRPFFVMELVRGIPITEYCDRNQLAPRERLELFVTVCQAIQHAHQKGIIHRDIKPSNVLVTSHDGKPVAKVIDFGVAKAIHQHLTERTIYTNFAQMIGTPLYMSPEQAEMSGLDIDTRSDIYSLGVMLYELLTGTTPLEKKRMAKAAYDEIRRLIREDDPPRPSTRLSTSDSIASIAAQRHTEPQKLSKLVRGDLDWITMKALEKDRTRRYETANGLARDLQRHLTDEPVEACPPSAGYRLQKFARKNRAALTTAAAILFVLIAGVAASTWQAMRASAEARRAQEALGKARVAAERAANAQRAEADRAAGEQRAREQAQKRLDQIEKGNEIVTSIFADLDIRQVRRGVEPLEAVLAKRLGKAAEQLEGEAVGDPLAVSVLQGRLGVSLLHLGYPSSAIPLLEKARKTQMAMLRPDHVDTLATLDALAQAYGQAGKVDLALSLGEETLRLHRMTQGTDHRDTLNSMSDLAMKYRAAGQFDKAMAMFEETLRLEKASLGPQDLSTLSTMNNLAIAYKDAGRVDLALPLAEDSVALLKARLGPDHPQVFDAMNNLGTVYLDAGRSDSAIALFDEALRMKKAKLGADHPDTLVGMSNLALAFRHAGKLERDLPLLEEALRIGLAKLGADHPVTLTIRSALASGYEAAGNVDRALPLLEENLKLTKAKLGAEHPSTLIAMSNLSSGYRSAGQLDRALPLLEEALSLEKGILGIDHPLTLQSMGNLASTLVAAGKAQLALPVIEEAFARRKAKSGAEHHETLICMLHLAECYEANGMADRALPLLEEAERISKRVLGPDHPDTLSAMNHLAFAYGSGRLDVVLPLFEETLRLRKIKLGADHPDTLVSMNNLGLGYTAAGKPAQALLLFEEAARGVEKRRFQDESSKKIVDNLIRCYEGLKQYERAEAWRRKLLVLLQERKGDPVEYADELAALGRILLQQSKWSDAEAALRECLAIRERSQPDEWRTFNVRSMLGEALVEQKRFAEAEPLLVAGIRGMRERESRIPAPSKDRLRMAAQRLVQLYEATSRPEEAERWKADGASTRAR